MLVALYFLTFVEHFAVGKALEPIPCLVSGLFGEVGRCGIEASERLSLAQGHTALSSRAGTPPPGFGSWRHHLLLAMLPPVPLLKHSQVSGL